MTKNNVRDKEFLIELDKERHFRLDLNAFCTLEESYEDVFGILENAEKGSLRALRAVLWAGLVHEDAELTEKRVGQMINPGNMAGVSSLITEAIFYYLPEAKNFPDPIPPQM